VNPDLPEDLNIREEEPRAEGEEVDVRVNHHFGDSLPSQDPLPPVEIISLGHQNGERLAQGREELVAMLRWPAVGRVPPVPRGEGMSLVGRVPSVPVERKIKSPPRKMR
jgi:hypothetical protein